MSAGNDRGRTSDDADDGLGDEAERHGTEEPVPRVVLITGGGRGIGAACARLAAAQGWSIAIGYARDADAAARLAASIRDDGHRAIAVQADVSVEADVLAMFAAVDAEFGRLDALVNNAGIVAPAARVEAYDAARTQRLLAVNVLGAFLCAREAVRRMSTRAGGAGGSIVNLSSVAARLGAPGEYVDYAACKGAIDTMTVGLAKEVAADGIRVNAVRPGLIETGIHASGGSPDRVARIVGSGAVPMGRAGQPDEVARAVVWLMSDEASYVSGALLDVGGGR